MQSFILLSSTWLEILSSEAEYVEHLVKFVFFRFTISFVAGPFTLKVVRFGWNLALT